MVNKNRFLKETHHLIFEPNVFMTELDNKLNDKYFTIFILFMLSAFFAYLFLYDRIILVPDWANNTSGSKKFILMFIKSYLRTSLSVSLRILAYTIWVFLKIGFIVLLSELFWKFIDTKTVAKIAIFSQFPYLVFIITNILSILIIKKRISFIPYDLVPYSLVFLQYVGILKIYSYFLFFLGMKSKFNMTPLICLTFCIIPFILETFINNWVWLYG